MKIDLVVHQDHGWVMIIVIGYKVLVIVNMIGRPHLLRARYTGQGWWIIVIIMDCQWSQRFNLGKVVIAIKCLQFLKVNDPQKNSILFLFKTLFTPLLDIENLVLGNFKRDILNFSWVIFEHLFLWFLLISSSNISSKLGFCGFHLIKYKVCYS